MRVRAFLRAMIACLKKIETKTGCLAAVGLLAQEGKVGENTNKLGEFALAAFGIASTVATSSNVPSKVVGTVGEEFLEAVEYTSGAVTKVNFTYFCVAKKKIGHKQWPHLQLFELDFLLLLLLRVFEVAWGEVPCYIWLDETQGSFRVAKKKTTNNGLLLSCWMHLCFCFCECWEFLEVVAFYFRLVEPRAFF